MSVVELYGKCKELGHCDCGGFFGCKDPDKFAAHEPLVAMVECTVCDRSHAPSHPHIANIDGDDPVDDEPAPAPSITEITGTRPIGRAALPDWLKGKPGAHVIQPATSTNAVEDQQLCQVCGEPWAPRHACKGAESPGTDFNRPVSASKKVMPYHMRKFAKCDVCGKKKQRNHKCQGRPEVAAVRPTNVCQDCERAGELCVRHGGVWSGYETPKVGQVARELPEPVPVTMPAPAAPVQPELDRELAAIATILAALDQLGPEEVQRAFAYVADRKGINKEQAK